MKTTKHPSSLMMTYGYKPSLSEGAVKPPIFLTSTFAFESAEEGKSYFELIYGLREPSEGEEVGLIYSRINNPNLEILEDRLCLWDQADACAVFESGMSAISTVFLTFLRPGDLLVYSEPTYGGTAHFIEHFLPELGIHALGFSANETQQEIEAKIKRHPFSDNLALIYIETPANPTNDIIDIAMCRDIADKLATSDKPIQVAVDNTYMGPLWSNPLKFGADLVIYSATKYLGGHSDLIAGAVLGKQESMDRIRVLRTFLGNMPSPHTCWLLLRSLETLELRMNKQAENAAIVADFLQKHPKVKSIQYLGQMQPSSPHYETYKRQYSSGGAMISFEVFGGEKSAFQVLNSLKLIKLAVSLGSTESLAQHPATMTHISLDEKKKKEMGISDELIRLSVGVEHPDDLIEDLSRALS